ncbi:MAG: HesA/MoeB/ThiF family protein [Rikenellaceae bacterium]
MTIDRERYTRQIDLKEVGECGQQRLAEASVLIVGVGGLGSPIATLLTSSGVGRIGIIDSDVVSISNLPRQTLYTEQDLGLPKVECAKRRLSAMNSTTIIESYNERLTSENCMRIVSNYDILVDGTDNADSRYLIDEICAELHKPYIYGAISGFKGQVSIFHYQDSGGYRDLYPKESQPAPTPPPAVISTTPALVGAIEANEVMKIVIGDKNTLTSKLLNIDLLSYRVEIFEI